MRKNSAGFTLLEIVIVVIVVAVLLALAAASYYKIIIKSEDSEALVNLKAIRDAEMAHQSASGTYLNATNTTEINSKLSFSEIADKIFTYKVVNATAETFVAIAERLKPDLNGESKPIILAMYMDGTSAYSSPSVSSGAATAGGAGGYLGGGSGGGGSGGGSGGGIGFGSSGGFGGTGGSGGSGVSGGSGSGGYEGSGSLSGGSSSGTSGGSTGGGGSGSGGSVNPIIPSAFIDDIVGVLKDAQNGSYFYTLMQEKNVNVTFADLPPNVGGQYVPSWWLDFYPNDPYIANTVYLSNALAAAWTKEEFSSILVHELTHADYSHNTEKWVADTIERLGVAREDLSWCRDPVTLEYVLGDSIDQEYNAFKQMVLLWREVRGSQRIYALDTLLSYYTMDEAYGTDLLYSYVASAYAGYPPY